ncbi:tryptophan-rich sensory protein [Rossellomorea vietnamensis]|uniref:Tryptophan-rich sensory protein n=2 Tax=Rossellomorea vietnamensis TaxID=218284 RepID=A0A6I6UKN5_9BACI|nr:tryptophan-rich sensory protein [Rossellomorea vietnamensis]QHE63635.1 tryptophan-rich sensory protein [Rossellomorea vietnamensis]
MMKLILNILAFALVIVMNTLAVTLPLNNQSTSEISDRLDIMITPAGYVFSIWSLIYLLLAIWIIRQFPKARRELPLYQETSGLFVLSCLLNSGWILVWHYNYFLVSVFVMLGLLLTLIALYKRVKSTGPSLLDSAPFSIYLGWISIATIVNITYYLTDIGWNGFGISELVWAYLGLIVATVLAFWFRITQHDLLYPLVFVWAFIGIGVKNMADHSTYSYTAYALAVIILIFDLVYKRTRK